MKHKFTNRLMNNFGLKIMALFFAGLLWLVVVNIDDPVDSQVYSNIPVTVKNEDVISSKGNMYQILDGTDTVRVTVSAKRSILSKIKAEDIVATADFNDMELVSLVPITASVHGYDGNSVLATATPHNMQVKVDAVKGSDFPLTVSTTGTLRDGYVLGSTTTSPEIITIRGSESLVNSIDKAVARISISGMSESETVNADLVLYDADGNVIDQTLLTNNLGEKGLTVDVEILDTKDVPIRASVSGTPEEGYAYDSLLCEPDTVKVCGTAEDLKKLDEIVIPSSELDISGLTEKKQYTIDISNYLPENISLVDDSGNGATIMITVTVEPLGTKTIEFPVESIIVSNLADGLKLEYTTTDDLPLQFQGSQDLLSKLEIKSAVFIDVKSYITAGEYDVPVTVETPTGVTLANQLTVKIKLSNKE